MKETIRTILSEWQDRVLPSVIERKVSLDRYLSSDHGDILTFNTEGKEEAEWFGYKIQVTMAPVWKFFYG